MSNQTFSRKVDKENITIGSCLADGFGMRIFVGGAFPKIVRKLLGTTFLSFVFFMKFS